MNSAPDLITEPLTADVAPSGQPASSADAVAVADAAPHLAQTVPATAGLSGSLIAQSVRQTYRDGVGIGYAAAVMDMREHLAGSPCDAVAREAVLTLLTQLSNRCDQIAEALA